MFVNDFENMFIRNVHANNAVELRELSLFLIMYADDTVLFAESAPEMQKMLDLLSEYCTTWKLSLNVDKTKIMVFRKACKVPKREKWVIDGNNVEIVDSFNYLGLSLYYSGKYNKTQNIIASQGRKCLFNLKKNSEYLFQLQHES